MELSSWNEVKRPRFRGVVMVWFVDKGQRSRISGAKTFGFMPSVTKLQLYPELRQTNTYKEML